MKFSDLPIGTFFYFPGCGALCLKTKADAYQPKGYSSKPTRCIDSPVMVAEEDFDGRPICDATYIEGDVG
jgi:hypothetical protein